MTSGKSERRSGRRRSGAPHDRPLVIGLAALTIGSVLAVGSIHPAVILVVGVGALALGVYATRGRPPSCSPAPVVLLLALALYSCAQAVPLPIAWLARLSPAAADVWSRSLLPMNEVVSWGSLSLDPGASIVEALKWSSYAALWFTAARVARASAELVFLCVFGAAVLVAASSVGHQLFGATSVWGLYEPTQPIPPTHFGPLLNANSLCGYLNMGVLLGIGLALRSNPIVPRNFLVVGVVALIAVSVRTASRGGIASLALALLVFAITQVVVSYRRTGSLPSGRGALIALGVVVAGTAGALIGAGDAFWSELTSTNQLKLETPRWVWPMASDFRFFGVGRGAFGGVFPAYQPATGYNVTFTHPENVIVQWVSEWGFPVGLGGLVTFGFMLRPTNLAFGRSSVATGSYLAVGALMLQNLADLGTEVFGVGVAVAVVLGASWGNPRRRRARERPSVWQPRLRVAFASATLLAALAYHSGLRTIEADRERLKSLVSAASTREEKRAVYSEIRGCVARHPADYYYPLMGSVVARSLGERPMPWLQRALERGPHIGRTHLQLAEVLADAGLARQAMLELKLAAGYEPGLAYYASSVALRLTRDPSTLLLAVPEGESGLSVLEALATGYEHSMPGADATSVLDEEALVRDPRAARPRQRLVERLFSQLYARSDACQDVSVCAEAIIEHADAFEVYRPTSALGPRTRAKLNMWEGNTQSADHELLEGCKRPDDRLLCLQLHAEVLSALNEQERMVDVLTAFATSSCGSTRPDCANAHVWVAELLMSRGDGAAAVESLRKAAREDSTPARWVMLADSAERSGNVAVALDALTRARTLGTEGLDGRIERLQREAVRPTH